MYTPTVNKEYFRNKAKKEKELKIRRMYEEGKSFHDIAEETDLSECEIVKILRLE